MQKIRKQDEGNYDVAKLAKMGQKFDLLTPKIMLKKGQNYEIYTSLKTIYGKYHSCKK